MTAAPPILAWYATDRVVMTDERRKWPYIRRWQLAGLVSVRPIDRKSAHVMLTEAGRARVESQTGDAP